MAVSVKPASAAVNTGGAFERLDSAAAPQTIASTPQRLAVGVHNAGLGWVEIHAHNAQGQVAATLASSTESHNAVSAALPGIREYLSGEHIRVGHLTSEVFSPPSGNREGSSQDRAQSRSSHSAKTTDKETQPAGAPGETEVEALSYINVRV